MIYNCIETGKGNATLSWEFLYETNTNTMPYGVIYKAMYDEHDYCNDTEEYFQNVCTRKKDKHSAANRTEA